MSWIDARAALCFLLALASAACGWIGLPMLLADHAPQSLLAYYGVNAAQLALVFGLPALLILAALRTWWRGLRGQCRPVSLRVFSANLLMAVGGSVTVSLIALLWAWLLRSATGYTGVEIPLPQPAGIGPWLAAILFVAAAPACCEELFFRTMLQQTLLRRWPRAGLWITALAFAALHFRWEAFPALLLVGLVLGLVCRRYGYWASALLHGLYNAAVLLLSVRGGGVSLALIAACCAACAVAAHLLFGKESTDETDRTGL